MAFLRVRIEEGDDAQPILLWDTVWAPWKGQGDWRIADADEGPNAGGLRAKAALATSVIICLFTDKRISKDHPLAYLVEGEDPRGWWGDGEDIRPEDGEREMGSLLWIFARAHLNDTILRYVEAEAIDALSTLLFQGAVAEIKVKATRPSNPNRVDLDVQLYGRKGALIYNSRFEDIWAQSVTAPGPEPFTSAPPV